ncbi:hypothetical protein [Dactylosporangium sp. CA-092794]|uniref:hypothetical protein n=1 Tax=Dactylosporangium sp. CA-092794 TaxID=3239929 RepID=UPI003D927AD5
MQQRHAVPPDPGESRSADDDADDALLAELRRVIALADPMPHRERPVPPPRRRPPGP